MVTGIGCVCRGFYVLLATNAPEIRALLDGKLHGLAVSRCLRASRASSDSDPRASGRIAEALGSDRDQVCARRASGRARPGRAGRRPSRSAGSRPPARTAWTCASATARTAGPETPPVRPAEPRLARCGDRAPCPRIVLISDSALAPASCAARATAATSDAFGVSLTISGLSVSGRTRSSSAAVSRGSAPITSPGLDVRAGDVQLERGDLVALGERAHELGDLLAAEAHHVDDQRHRAASRAPGGRPRGSPSSPLFGSPIELIIPPASSHSRGGGLPCRGSSVTVFETNAANGKCSISSSPNARCAAIASNVPEPLMIGCSSSIPQNSTACQCPAPATSAVSSARRRAPGPSTHSRT